MCERERKCLNSNDRAGRWSFTFQILSLKKDFVFLQDVVIYQHMVTVITTEFVRNPKANSYPVFLPIFGKSIVLHLPLGSNSWLCFHCCLWYAPHLSSTSVSSCSWQGRSVQAHLHMDVYVWLITALNMSFLPLNLCGLSGAVWGLTVCHWHMSLTVAVTICLVAWRNHYGVINLHDPFSLPLSVNSSDFFPCCRLQGHFGVVLTSLNRCRSISHAQYHGHFHLSQWFNSQEEQLKKMQCRNYIINNSQGE